MSERPPPGVAEDAAIDRAQALTPEAIERILADFRSWLHDLARSPGAEASRPVGDEDLESIDLFTLLGQLAALRHEVHLQTRAVRAQQEQNTETLRELSAALATLREARPAAPEEGVDGNELLRPLLKTLVDLYDALSLAAREVQRVQDTILAVPPEPARPPSPEVNADGERREAAEDQPVDRVQLLLHLAREWEATGAQAREQARLRKPGLLARWFGAGAQEREALAAEWKVVVALREALTERYRSARQEQQEQTREELARSRRLLDSLITGYTMSLQRLERALRQHDLEPLPCVGQPFDPERMEVLEIVTGSGLPSGEVVEEVRRGYLWRGRVFRYAQVRVAKS